MAVDLPGRVKLMIAPVVFDIDDVFVSLCLQFGRHPPVHVGYKQRFQALAPRDKL